MEAIVFDTLPDLTTTPLAERIRFQRRRQELRQSVRMVAPKIGGVHHSRLSAWEDGACDLKPEQIQRYAKLLGILPPVAEKPEPETKPEPEQCEPQPTETAQAG